MKEKNLFNYLKIHKVEVPENINISVFDLSGRKVQQLVDGFYLPGNHVVKWDGSGYNGNTVASGIYIYQLTGPNLLITRKMLLLK